MLNGYCDICLFFLSSRTVKKDCPAKIVIAARRDTQELELTCANLEHNHDTTPDMFASYPENSRLNDEQFAFVRPLIDMNVQPSFIAQ
ncbi:hypothetical protein HPB48_011922 [Haemaphysalis longicornis]|uniref:Uncharacterized protein n=1 Tax=Haemaphysalis longicornis TaxID=44386 RepID=A0A9J6FWW2_HAELO|nr:hypothetical protein HPB48_011922 [Haemaphysalis longicornis]